ncbi:MAG: hypothetical protein E7018_03750 [Alphaproteobacteria bacterium]|nr:hypothetical protein [Alphaproteobacteria bacterium]
MNNIDDQIRDAEEEASLLMGFSKALTSASTCNDNHVKLMALDENLKLWVGIESSLKSAKNLLPQEIKENLLKLSKYVERLTISKGVDMSKTDFDCLANINMQISEGLLAVVRNSLAKEEAFSLLKCAIDLSNAHESKNSGDLINALDNNLQLWVYIKTLAKNKSTALPEETKSNLIKLADYVSSKTLEVGKNLDKVDNGTIESFINANLQISEGLITSQKIA